MIRFFNLLLFALIFIAPSANLAAQQQLRMEHKLKGLQTGPAKLIGMFGDQNYIADSIFISTPDQFYIYKR